VTYTIGDRHDPELLADAGRLVAESGGGELAARVRDLVAGNAV
jgi:hypothetical protein